MRWVSVDLILSWSDLWQMQLPPPSMLECSHTHTHTHTILTFLETCSTNMWVFTIWPINIPSDDQLWLPLICLELETTRVCHQTQHLWFFGTLHGALSFLLCLGWPEISCRLGSKLSSSWKFSSPLAGEELLRQVPILYQWLKPRLWLFTLRATSSWKQI